MNRFKRVFMRNQRVRRNSDQADRRDDSSSSDDMHVNEGQSNIDQSSQAPQVPDILAVTLQVGDDSSTSAQVSGDAGCTAIDPLAIGGDGSDALQTPRDQVQTMTVDDSDTLAARVGGDGSRSAGYLGASGGGVVVQMPHVETATTPIDDGGTSCHADAIGDRNRRSSIAGGAFCNRITRRGHHL